MITVPLNIYSPYNSDPVIPRRPHPEWGKSISVTGAFSSMKESSNPPSPSSSSSNLAVSPDSISFEVLYVGKLRMWYRNAPPSFVDEALYKFKSHEHEKTAQGRRDSILDERRRSSSQESCSSSCENIPRPTIRIEEESREDEGKEAGGCDKSVILNEELNEGRNILHPLMDLQSQLSRVRNPSGDGCLVKSMSLPVEPMRNRALSTGHLPRNKSQETNKIGSSDYNRTMILIVGKCEMKIISPDAKTLLFSKHFREIYQSSQGMKNKEYFGFICRELPPNEGSNSNTPAYVAFVFRCQSDSVAGDILNVLRQASAVTAENIKKERVIQSCDHCPMVWYRQLCAQVDGLSSRERIQLIILKYINGLVEEDTLEILAKFHGAEPSSMEEKNKLLMMLLRVHCESKQVKHIHDTTQNRHEFLNQYLGGGAILKAKRSITNSIDQLIKRKGRECCVEEDSPLADVGGLAEVDSPGMAVSNSPIHRPRSSTLGSTSGDNIKFLLRNRRTSQGTLLTPSHDNLKNSPMMNLFQKVGSQSKAVESDPSVRRSGSWRHAIFKKVVSPVTSTSSNPHRHPATPLSSKTFKTKKTPAEFRELWKTAINQQIILIRMEKQNLRIKAEQEEADVKRIKLSYKPLGTCDQEANDTWDLIISQTVMNPKKKCDIQLLNSALLRGIPQHKRGQIWEFFIQQRGSQPLDLPHLNLQRPYEELLRQLTSQQHAILIDLGRTFPGHPYFSSALGSGQLALFNILKAYSLLDTDVGYCQGLSFVAGLLLMHLEEEEAFSVLKYIMFDLGAREHYKPDMHELQVKLYQLTRLIHDQDQDLLLLLNYYDVLPSLYAAPWFLTLFASQFSIGFVVRVLDVLLLHGVDVIAKFAVVIILDHKKELMKCTGLEQVMDCFKTVVTNISSDKLDLYLRKVLESDWDKQMLTYSVEYSVMNDEAFHAFLTESSSSVPGGVSMPQSIRSKAQQSDRSSQTDSTCSTSGEKHPILGDLIQRQNLEISKMKQEKFELRKDVTSLLDCLITMQKLSRLGSDCKISISVPPEVTSIASKYFLKSGCSYARVLEGSLTEHPSSRKEMNSRAPSGVPTLDAESEDSSDPGSSPSSLDSPIDPSTKLLL